MIPFTLIQALEPRLHCSISMIAGHVLSVHGAGGYPNTITAGLNPGVPSIYVTVSYTTRKGLQTQTKDYLLSTHIRALLINGGNAADQITIDQTNGAFPIRTVINTHNGNDTVTAGDEPDKITLGRGADSVFSGGGDDILYAGSGADSITGGNGHDVFHGGHGHDSITAGDGVNVIYDPYGHDTIQTGTGHDVYVLRSISLDSTNFNSSKDRLVKYQPPTTPGESVGQQVLNGLLDSFLF